MKQDSAVCFRITSMSHAHRLTLWGSSSLHKTGWEDEHRIAQRDLPSMLLISHLARNNLFRF